MAYTIIPAQPGWRCLFGFLDKYGCDAWLSDIVAWRSDEEGNMVPIVSDHGTDASPEIDTGGNGLIKIFGPSDTIPSDEKMEEIARTILTIRHAAAERR